MPEPLDLTKLEHGRSPEQVEGTSEQKPPVELTEQQFLDWLAKSMAKITEELNVAPEAIAQAIARLGGDAEQAQGELNALSEEEAALRREIVAAAKGLMSEELGAPVEVVNRSQPVVKETDPNKALADSGAAGDDEILDDLDYEAPTIDEIRTKKLSPREERALNREQAANTLLETIISFSRRYGNDLSNPLVQMRRIWETRSGVTLRVDREGSIVMGIPNISGEAFSQPMALLTMDDVFLFEPLQEQVHPAYDTLRTPDFSIAPVHPEDLQPPITAQEDFDVIVQKAA